MAPPVWQWWRAGEWPYYGCIKVEPKGLASGLDVGWETKRRNQRCRPAGNERRKLTFPGSSRQLQEELRGSNQDCKFECATFEFPLLVNVLEGGLRPRAPFLLSQLYNHEPRLGWAVVLKQNQSLVWRWLFLCCPCLACGSGSLWLGTSEVFGT